MRGAARYILFAFAIIAVTAILLVWKRQDRVDAKEELKTIYSADITIVEEVEKDDSGAAARPAELIVGCSSDKLVDLEAFAAVVKRFGEPTVLDLTACPNLASLRGIESFSKLKSLIAIDCPKLTSVEGVAGLSKLTELVLTDSQRFSDASAVRDLPALTTIDMSGCLTLKKLELRGLPLLQNLYLSRTRELEAVDLTPVPKLQQFYADGCAGLKNIGGLETLVELTDLDVSNCDSLSELKGLSHLKKLVVLDIRNMPMSDYSEIAKLSSLRVLRMGGQENIETLEPFSSLTGLREIHLEACPNFRSLKGIPPSLTQYAAFTFCPELKSLSGLSSARALEHLDVSGCEFLKDVADLEHMDALIQLSLTKCRQVSDINHVKGLKKLGVVLLGGSGVLPTSIKELQADMKETVFDFLLAEQKGF